MRELHIREFDLSCIHEAIDLSYYHEACAASDENFNAIYKKYERFINFDDFIEDKELIGFSSKTQYNLYMSKCHVYSFDNIENLRYWINTVEGFINNDGIENSVLVGKDPRPIIARLRDFCDGSNYDDPEIAAYRKQFNI